MDREQGLAIVGAAGARAAAHWAPGRELIRPDPNTHLPLRLGTQERNRRLYNYNGQNGPRNGAGASRGEGGLPASARCSLKIHRQAGLTLNACTDPEDAPLNHAGKAACGVEVMAVAVQALQRPAAVDLRPDPSNPRSKPDLASRTGWVMAYLQVGCGSFCGLGSACEGELAWPHLMLQRV